MKIVTCQSCGYNGDIITYLPSMSATADCKCPKCGSTNNHHNDEYADALQKAWNCKHTGALTDGGQTTTGAPMLKCTSCGSVGLDWAMREKQERLPRSQTSSP